GLPSKELYRRPEIIQHRFFQFSYSKFRHSNHRIGAHTCTNHTVPYGTALLGGDRGRDKGRLCPSLRTGLADLLHPALQSVVNFQEDQPTQSPALSGSSRHCLPLPGQPIDSGLETKVRVFASALHRTESIRHLRWRFPSYLRSASRPSCLP